MQKKLSKNNLIKPQRETLKNILSSKGIIYTYYKNKITKGNYARKFRTRRDLYLLCNQQEI